MKRASDMTVHIVTREGRLEVPAWSIAPGLCVAQLPKMGKSDIAYSVTHVESGRTFSSFRRPRSSAWCHLEHALALAHAVAPLTDWTCAQADIEQNQQLGRACMRIADFLDEEYSRAINANRHSA